MPEPTLRQLAAQLRQVAVDADRRLLTLHDIEVLRRAADVLEERAAKEAS